VATTSEGRTLIEANRLLQLRLTARLARDVSQLMPSLDYEDIKGSWPGLEAALVAATEQNRRRSAGIAATIYSRFRVAEGVVGSFSPRPPNPLDLDQLRINLRVVGPGTAGNLVRQARPDVAQITTTKVIGEVQRNVANGGREVMQNSVAADPQAVGWIRILGDNPCAFCTMLASRGPVYKSRDTARAVGTDRQTGQAIFSDRIDDFAAHQHCGCTVEPVYDETAPWPDKNQEALDRWNDVTSRSADPDNPDGRPPSGIDALNALRRSLNDDPL
jgi:hypothetical protein